MERPLRQWLIAAAAVFVLAVVLSAATGGLISDIAFVIYAGALAVLLVLLVVLLFRLVRAGAGQQISDTDDR